MPKKKTEPFNFEQSLASLTQLIEKMEHGNLPLEDSLESFEQGVKLIKQCQHALSNAEQKVEILTKNQQQETLKPFEVDHNDD